MALVNAPSGTLSKLEPLPAGAKVTTKASKADVVLGFAKGQAELMKIAPVAIKMAKADGLLWLCYPKGGAKANTGLDRDVLWQIVEERHGLEGVTLVAVDETWSAMRFRPPGAGKKR